ncbi:MAG TPA: energy transducer TonB [Lacunisphaera sp.]
MNIQRYKWPVIVAAGLHGALFLSTPDSSRGYDRNTDPKPQVLPAIPVDVIFQLPPDDDSSADDRPAAGSVAVPTLPDNIAPLTDKTDFITPVVDHPHVENPIGTLKGYVGGPEGPTVGSLSPNTGSVIDLAKLDKNPRATAQISPNYPASMRQDGITGSVTVKFEVNKDGRVTRAEAIGYTRREFVEPALVAVRNWHFEPGKQNGRTVAFRMTVPIEFSLDRD